MRRRILIVVIVAIAAVPSVFAEASFSTYIGGSFFRYEQGFLTTGVTYLGGIGEQLELDLGVDFGIATETDSQGQVTPQFFVPVEIGLNFTFPGDLFSFYFGPGLSAIFYIQPAAEPPITFFVGPFLHGGVRVRVHAIMSLFAEVQQDLLIGGTMWVNTATRVCAGINFSL